MKKFFAAAFSIALLLLLPAAAFSANVKYEVWVQTGSAKGAETSAAITIMLTNERGDSSPALALRTSSNNRVPFGAGKLDKFVLQLGKDLGPIKTITLKSDNAGKAPEWRLESVKVFYAPPSGKPDPRYPVEGKRNVTNFRYGDWIAKDRKLVVTLATVDTIAAAGGAAGAPQRSKPPAPAQLAATAQSPATIQLNWTYANPNRGTVSFKIERSASASGGFAEVGEIAAGKTAFVSGGLAPNTTYYFRVKAHVADAYSDYSAVASARTPALPTPPAMPSDLRVSIPAAGKVTLTWRDNSDNEGSFRIESSADRYSGFVEVARANANATSHTVSNLTPGTVIWFRIRAHNSGGYSLYTNVKGAEVQPPVPVPTLFGRAEYNKDENYLYHNILWWDTPPITVSTVYLERSASPASGFSVLSEVNLPNTMGAQWSNNLLNRYDKKLASGSTFYYRIRCKTGIYNLYSDYSPVVSLTAVLLVPHAPQNLRATPLYDSRIQLNWTDDKNNSGFRVERSTSANGGFSQIALISVNRSTYMAFDLDPNTTYYFRVRATSKWDPALYSDYSEIVSGKPLVRTSQ